MKFPFSIILFLAVFFLPGCIITDTPGFYSGYKKLPAAERAKIRLLPAGAAIPAGNHGFIYAVDAGSLLQAIKGHDSTLVYIWGPHCHSAHCASLLAARSACNSKGYQLYVVAQYYADMEEISLQPQLDRPLLAINHKSYGTDYCPKYTRRFEAALRQGQKLPDSTRYSRYYLFHRGRFVRALDHL